MKELLCKHQHTAYMTNLFTLISVCQEHASEFFATPLTPETCIKCSHREIVTQEAINNHIDNIAKVVGDQLPLMNKLADNLENNIEIFCHVCDYFDSPTGLCRACNCSESLIPVKERALLLNISCPLNLW